MHAAWYSRNGPARDVLIVGELPTPEPGPGEVRVKLHVSGVNPSDVKSRMGRPLIADRIIPHSDGAGVIDQVGEGVSSERVGQRVWVWNGQWKRPFGTAAQYIVLAQSQAVPLSDSVSFEVGACLAIPVLTAIQAIRLAGNLKERTVLVTGAGNVVGHYVAQLATREGATVIGTVGSSERRDLARASGVAHAINYKLEDVAQRVLALTDQRGVDVIIDMDLSSTSKLLSAGVLSPHGWLIGYGSNTVDDIGLNFRALLWRSLGLKFFLVYEMPTVDREASIAMLNTLLDTNQLTHVIGQTFVLEDIAKAHQAVESGQVVGNILVTL